MSRGVTPRIAIVAPTASEASSSRTRVPTVTRGRLNARYRPPPSPPAAPRRPSLSSRLSARSAIGRGYRDGAGRGQASTGPGFPAALTPALSHPPDGRGSGDALTPTLSLCEGEG